MLKLVAKKYPTCNLIDCQDDDISNKCQQSPKVIVVGKTAKCNGWGVTVCTGSFNVYVLDVTPRSEMV